MVFETLSHFRITGKAPIGRLSAIGCRQSGTEKRQSIDIIIYDVSRLLAMTETPGSSPEIETPIKASEIESFPFLVNEHRSQFCVFGPSMEITGH